MSRITFLGLGAMGRRMATRLLAAGHAVTVWNRSPQPIHDLRAQGAVVGDSPRDAVAHAEIVFAMVFDDVASRRTWLDPDSGALAGLPSSAIAVESSTLSPGWIATLAEAMASRGIAFVDAPVAGSRPQADAGQLIFMAGGDTDVVDRLQPVLLQMGRAVHHVGPSGSGAWLKLAVNALFAVQVAAVAEQLALLREAGLDTGRALEALRAMPVMSPAAAGAAALMLAGDYAPQAPIDLIAKDLDYAMRASRSDMPLVRATVERLAAAQAAGYGHENIVAVAKLADAAASREP